MSDSKNENKLKHLEFIQSTISRMNNNSFLIKGWLVTLTAAIFVLSTKDSNTIFLWVCPAITILFWTLDAFFISNERMYRTLYNVVRTKQEEDIDFDMNVSDYQVNENRFFRSFFLFTLLLFYPMVLVFSIIG